MITFKTCTYKNFLSTGNTPTKVFLNRVPSIIITGQNGAGKSTLLDAITFGIYGKPYRNINKPQLINTVNEKNLEVEVEFDINSVPYKIVRGVKPAKFEIYRNGDLIPHDAAAKDYQARLEGIIGLNYKAFTQIVILGSARYQSFMDLSSNDRRTIIEEILDITVFSKMNSVLKTRVQNNDLEQKENNYQKELLDNRIKNQQKLISNILRRSKESDDKIEAEKARLNLLVTDIDEKIALLDDKLSNLVEPNLDELHDKLTDVKMKGHELKKREKTAEDRIIFYENSHSCEVCQQPISDHIKSEQIELMKSELEVVNRVKQPMAEAFQSIQTKIDKANVVKKEIAELNSERRSLITEKKTILNQVKDLESQKIQTDADDLEESKNNLSLYETQYRSREDEYLKLIEDKHHLEVCKVLLKDEGIKAKIIKQYLPVMNQLINKFLDRMGANYSFHLDEQFNEVIKSRYRDSFSYASFSEGEKQRIDLALVFTWREIAKIKNSVNTNLLIMDEIGDSSMDGEGTDILWEILSEMKDTNLFVISHKTSNVDKFSSHIEFEKVGNFSKIKDSKT